MGVNGDSEIAEGLQKAGLTAELEQQRLRARLSRQLPTADLPDPHLAQTMKLVDKSGWPKVGTKWNTQDDLLLVCELAAARAGFSGLQVSATSRAGNVRCSVTSPAGVDGKRKINCNAILCSFVVEQGKLVVQSLNTSKLSADAHGEAHKDRSVPLVS